MSSSSPPSVVRCRRRLFGFTSPSHSLLRQLIPLRGKECAAVTDCDCIQRIPCLIISPVCNRPPTPFFPPVFPIITCLLTFAAILMATVCPEFKVILCGEYGVGKTSLFRRFMNNTFIDTSNMSSYESRASSVGLDHFSRRIECNGKAIKIQLWDTGGLERVASITNSYYKFAEAALLVFSLNSIESFHCLSQHLLEILSMAENAKIFLVGNKLDLEPHEVTDDIVELFIEQFPRFNGYFKISCKTDAGIEEMIDEITNVLSSTSYSFKDTFEAFTLHGQHTAGECCTNPDPNHEHPSSSSGSSGGGGSCCAK